MNSEKPPIKYTNYSSEFKERLDKIKKHQRKISRRKENRKAMGYLGGIPKI